jgi:hypothetical protein
MALDEANKEGWVYVDIANHPNTPSATLERMALDDDEAVRYGVAENPSTPTPTLTLLTGDEDADVVYAAQEALKTRSQSTVVWMMSGSGL